MTNREFANRAKQIADDYETAYMLGGFGQRITAASLEYLIRQYPKNKQYETAARAHYGNGFLFDCIGFVKAILWGWAPDFVPYKTNGVPDVNEQGMLELCTDVSEDFSRISAGEYLWMQGHCGIYLGDGLAAESTPALSGGVQITAVGNIGEKAGYYSRKWEKHGRLPWIVYSVEPTPGVRTVTVTLKELELGARGDQVKSLQQLLVAKGFSCGHWGADGDFGSSTESAVKAYQRQNAAKCGGADGIVGVKTWSCLLGA